MEKISAEVFDVLPGSSAKMIAIKKSVDALQPGRYDRLPLACRLFAENVLRLIGVSGGEAGVGQIDRQHQIDRPMGARPKDADTARLDPAANGWRRIGDDSAGLGAQQVVTYAVNHAPVLATAQQPIPRCILLHAVCPIFLHAPGKNHGLQLWTAEAGWNAVCM